MITHVNINNLGQKIMRYLLGLCLFVFSVSTAQSDTLSMSIESHHPNVVSLEFYSQDYNRAWPGDGQVYVLDDSNTHNYNLECQTGEQICFGAWVRNQSDTYWGVGMNDANNCTNCCYTCGDGGSNVQVLNP
jgi:hypothetical protein